MRFSFHLLSNQRNLVLSHFHLWFILQVSWVRHRDIHLLTVGRYTYTSDQRCGKYFKIKIIKITFGFFTRFEAMHSPHTEEWTLRIRYAQRKDSGNVLFADCGLTKQHLFHQKVNFFSLFIQGIYECQISTTPPVGHFVYLTVVGKLTLLFRVLKE